MRNITKVNIGWVADRISYDYVNVIDIDIDIDRNIWSESYKYKFEIYKSGIVNQNTKDRTMMIR